MTERSVKELCLEAVTFDAGKLDEQALKACSAQEIAARLQVSRNLVSQYLNEYHAQGTVMKIGRRPVLYLNRSVHGYPGLLPLAAADPDEVLGLLQKTEEDPFSSLIGASGSLHGILQSCKSAVIYPGSGLTILLHGPSGTGKSLIARRMHEYARQQRVIPPSGKLVTVNCSEYANNPEFFLTSLFGSVKGAYTGADQDRDGLIAIADNGFLFLDEVQSLTSECQEKLFLFMDRGIYHKVGDNDTWHSASVHLVFATTEDPGTVLLKTLSRRIALMVKIPSLAQRPKQEKKELIRFLLGQESEAIGRPLQITRRLYDILTDLDYRENIGQLKSAIRAITANALYIQKDRPSLVLDIADLPADLADICGRTRRFMTFTDETPLSLAALEQEQAIDVRLLAFCKDLLQLDHAQKEGSPEFWRRARIRFGQYLDSLVFNGREAESRQPLYHGVIELTCRKLAQTYSVAFGNSEISNLALLLEDYRASRSCLAGLEARSAAQIRHLCDRVCPDGSDLKAMTADFAMKMQENLNMETGFLFVPVFALSLRFLSIDIDERQTRGIILSHGYSTASSMAAAVNYMLDEPVLDAIDMPMETTLAQIAGRLERYIRSQKNLKDLVIMVDMGSLEGIHRHLPALRDVNLVIASNVTMKMALETAMILNRGGSAEQIRTRIEQEDWRPSVLFVENRQKQRAIVTTCATGIGTAEKISSLIRDSLPDSADVQVVEAGYQELCASRRQAPVFSEYDVLFVVGTMDPGLPDTEFVSMEELVDQQHLDRIKRLLQGLVPEEDMEAFSRRMVKNFSLQNLLDYLTIINPKKIIDYVEDILASLQEQLDMTFSSNVTVGLYIHISCLIERLIVDRYITSYGDLEAFERDHGSFIRIVKKSFARLEQHYSVSIPVSEIAYLHDYIYRRPSVENGTDSVEDSLF